MRIAHVKSIKYTGLVSLVTGKIFYGLAADRQEYCFTKDIFFIFLFFLKFIFEPKPLFFQIRIENSLGGKFSVKAIK